MASPTRWAWVWVNSGSLWWTQRPGVLRFMGSQRVGHDWVTELNWTELKIDYCSILMTAAWKSLSDDSNIWFMPLLASVYYLFSFNLWLSWFLVLWVIFSFMLHILVIMLGDSWSYLNLLFRHILFNNKLPCIGLVVGSGMLFQALVPMTV